MSDLEYSSDFHDPTNSWNLHPKHQVPNTGPSTSAAVMDLPITQRRPKTPPQPPKSVSPGDNPLGSLSPTTACQLNLSQKSPSKNDRASPEPNCSICLGKLVDKSFTNGCLHIFCFGCLVQWSKIKAECPLCKQSFKSIIHNVRSMHEFDEYNIPPLNTAPRCQMGTNVYQTYQDFLSTIEVHTSMAQRLPFRYSTTVTGDRRFQAQFYTTTVNSGWVLPPSHASHRSSGRLFRQRRNVVTNQFRASVYEQDLWAQPPTDLTGRLRDCSPGFYRANQAQVHRLVPWLHRELEVLLNSRGVSAVVLDLILKSITRYEVDSTEVRRLLHPHLGERTDHFIHEFHTFARSHFDLIGYDTNVTYGPNPVPNVSIQVVSDDSSDDSDVLILPQDTAEPSVAGPSGVSRRRPQSAAAPQPPLYDADSDECQFVEYIKPRHERTPEIIDLSSEDERLVGDETIAIDLGSLSPIDEIQMDELLDYKLEDLDTARLMLENLDSISSPPSVDNSTSSEYLPPKSISLAQLRMEKEESKKKPVKKVSKTSAKGKSRGRNSKRAVKSRDEETRSKKRKTTEEKKAEERGKKTRRKRTETVTKLVNWERLSASSDDDVPLVARSRKRAKASSARYGQFTISSSDDDTRREVPSGSAKRSKTSSTAVYRTSQALIVTSDEETNPPLTSIAARRTKASATAVRDNRHAHRHFNFSTTDDEKMPVLSSMSSHVGKSSSASKRYTIPLDEMPVLAPTSLHAIKPSSNDRMRPTVTSRSIKPTSTAVRETLPDHNYSNFQVEREFNNNTFNPPISPVPVRRLIPGTFDGRLDISCDEALMPTLLPIPDRIKTVEEASSSHQRHAQRRNVLPSDDEVTPPVYTYRTQPSPTSVLDFGLKSSADKYVTFSSGDDLPTKPSITSPAPLLASYTTKPSSSGNQRWPNHPDPTPSRTAPFHSRSSAHMFASSDEESTTFQVHARRRSINLMEDTFPAAHPSTQFNYFPSGYADDDTTLPFANYYITPAHRPEDVIDHSVPSTSRAIPSVIVSPIRNKGKDMPKLWNKMSEHLNSHSDNSDVPTWSIRNSSTARDDDIIDGNSSSASTEPEERRPKLKSIVITRTANQYRASLPTGPAMKRKHKRKKSSKRAWKRETRRLSDSSNEAGPSRWNQSTNVDTPDSDDTESSS